MECVSAGFWPLWINTEETEDIISLSAWRLRACGCGYLRGKVEK